VKTLENEIVGQTYYVDHLKNSMEKEQLQNLGITKGKQIMVVSLDSDNAIVLLQDNRIAMDKRLLGEIYVTNQLEDDFQLESLDNIKPGTTVIVQSIESTGAVRRRLMDMGITRGVKIFLRKVAPLGDPIELHLRGYALSLRKAEASHVMVKILKEDGVVK
jgi:Fe2+ transport system protein A